MRGAIFLLMSWVPSTWLVQGEVVLSPPSLTDRSAVGTALNEMKG